MTVVQELRDWLYRLAAVPLPMASGSILSSTLMAINKEIEALGSNPSSEALDRIRVALQALQEAIEDAIWLQQVRDRKVALCKRSRTTGATIAGDEADVDAAQRARSASADHAHRLGKEFKSEPTVSVDPRDILG